MQNFRALLVLLVMMLAFSPVTQALADEIVVYSARKEHLIKPIFDQYTKETGTKITFITDKAGPLLQRLKAEGKNTQADLLLTVDAGNLWHAANEGLLQAVESDILTQNVPPHLRDPRNFWFGLSLRARTIVYSTERVKPEDLSTYEDLGSKQWHGRLLLRTSKKVYNQSLTAMLIAEHGEARAEQLIKSWVDNLAAPPFSSDTKVLKAILAGQGDVGIINTYYFGRLLKKDPNLRLALFWPNQNDTGVHVNISGGGVVKHARNTPGAQKFLEWLSSAKAQALFAGSNLEYPVNPKVETDPEVAAWGDFKKSRLNLSKAGELQADAIRLMDRAGYR